MQVGSADKSLAGANQRPLLKSVGPELQRLKERDNYTNYRYIAANYAVFIATISGDAVVLSLRGILKARRVDDGTHKHSGRHHYWRISASAWGMHPRGHSLHSFR